MIRKYYPLKLFIGVLIFSITIQPLIASQKRIALIIGNSNYNNISTLKNPVNNANDMALQFTKLGFQVDKLIDAKQQQMDQAIRNFAHQMGDKDTIALFYFSGHAVQLNQNNYLIPIASTIHNKMDIKANSVEFGVLLEQLKDEQNSLNLIILDASQENPYANQLSSIAPGLAKIETALPQNSVILYAASPGQVAVDAEGRNSLFTEKLLQLLKNSKLSIADIINQTVKTVSKSSQSIQFNSNKQQVAGKSELSFDDMINQKSKVFYNLPRSSQFPYKKGKIINDFYFSSASTNNYQANKQTAIVEHYNTDDKQQDIFWTSVERTPSIEGYQVYLQQYPNGVYQTLALLKIKQLTQLKKQPLDTKIIPAQTKLTVRSNVYDDNVTINGEDKGSTRLDLQLKPGSYDLIVSKSGYISWEKNLHITAGDDQMVYAKLKKISSPYPVVAQIYEQPQKKEARSSKAKLTIPTETDLVSQWQQLLSELKDIDSGLKKVKYINQFFNAVPIYSDKSLWGVEDYWATPMEMLNKNGGDSEDRAIGKYISLKKVNIPVEKMRISYCKNLKLNRPVMVLSYYPELNADPYILDWNNKLQKLSEREELERVYSFNDKHLWKHDAKGDRKVGNPNRILRWRELLNKIESGK
ncbi:MAG: caspase family protein [gamma proteobacterium symbiont of Taylorina sp.]|nr:caspase family protein [gamma proteobacterium symbiont of Taylorina sp.]